MKKGKLTFVFFISIILLLSISLSYALNYPADCAWATQGVCGQCPDSTLGFGQVEVWGVTYSCNNVADGVCPEDYEDAYNSSLYGDCSSCVDPDCTGTVYGTVKNFYGSLVDKATVTSNPVKWNLSAPSIQNSIQTSVAGAYSMQVVTGKYFFSASKESYDTELIEARVWRNKNTNINFTLLDGTCHEDCTNSYNRCNAGCQGLSFNNGTNSCSFYDAKAQELCNNRLLGTTVFYNASNSTHAYFIDCCEGTPYVSYYSKLTVDSSKIKDLVNIEKISRYNDVPVKIVVAYWSPVRE